VKLLTIACTEVLESEIHDASTIENDSSQSLIYDDDYRIIIITFNNRIYILFFNDSVIHYAL